MAERGSSPSPTVPFPMDTIVDVHWKKPPDDGEDSCGGQTPTEPWSNVYGYMKGGGGAATRGSGGANYSPAPLVGSFSMSGPNGQPIPGFEGTTIADEGALQSYWTGANDQRTDPNQDAAFLYLAGQQISFTTQYLTRIAGPPGSVPLFWEVPMVTGGTVKFIGSSCIIDQMVVDSYEVTLIQGDGGPAPPPFTPCGDLTRPCWLTEDHSMWGCVDQKFECPFGELTGPPDAPPDTPPAATAIGLGISHPRDDGQAITKPTELVMVGSGTWVYTMHFAKWFFPRIVPGDPGAILIDGSNEHDPSVPGPIYLWWTGSPGAIFMSGSYTWTVKANMIGLYESAIADGVMSATTSIDEYIEKYLIPFQRYMERHRILRARGMPMMPGMAKR